jgi:hypothetical protein
MKRKILFATGFVLIALSFNSCEGLFGNCKICQENTYNETTGLLITEGPESEYCDARLLEVEAKRDETVGGITSRWVCR